MPIYGYRCSQCGHELEVFQSMSAEPLRECPECGGALGKMLYPVGVHFKGSGFYTTDYKNGSSSKSERDKRDGDAKDGTRKDGDSGSKSDSDSGSSSDAGAKKSDSKSAGSGESGGGTTSTSEKKAESPAAKE
jgi:putative FmdB family regulatory protein